MFIIYIFIIPRCHFENKKERNKISCTKIIDYREKGRDVTQFMTKETEN